jgi:glycosyltransferase involved in cell wall biosynthesis
MRILVATDAWHPQVNGVVRTYERLRSEGEALGAHFSFITPAEFRTLPCPTYPEIRLSLVTQRTIARRIAAAAPDFIHIATEGPIGLMTRRYCRKMRKPFTTSYHTRFPEYLSARLPIPESWGDTFQRRFHNASSGVMVATQSLTDDLQAHGFERLVRWTRGVDTELFHPRPVRLFGQEPVFLYVGRVAIEKNIGAFLDLQLPGRKVVVGSGPQEAELKRRYPDVLFAGSKEGEELAAAYASADVFVFPSLTDTFGLVLLEALASGVPVAAYPVCGPKDVVTDSRTGVLDTYLGRAALAALSLDREQCRKFALSCSWRHSAQQFLDNVLDAHGLGPVARTPRRAANKKAARVGGNPSRFKFMRQFGGRLGNSRPH